MIHLAFWTAAWIDLGAVLILALLGLRQIRRGAWQAHRRCMLAAAALVGLFLLVYLLKLQWLGHEDLDSWSAAEVRMLRLHELGIAAMLVGGALAGWRAWGFRDTLPQGPQLPARDERRDQRSGHRRVGRIAIAGAVVAWVSAALMLAGMYGRGT